MTEPMMITDGRTARRDRNRLAVLDAVLELFAAGDLSPSLEDVAQRSGLSLRSVYRYMSDSEDLVHAAIERHLEKVRPLFAFEPSGLGTFTQRVDAFVAVRLRLYEAIAPTARAAQARAHDKSSPGSEMLSERLADRRKLLRKQLERQFAAELAAMGDQAPAILAAADGLTQIETIDWFVLSGGCSIEQTNEALAAGLHRLLGPQYLGEP
jgi:AcrR family transcriptional regulator